MKLVHINECSFRRVLSEEDRKPPFQTFYEDVVKFVHSLMADPIGARPSGCISSVGNGELRKSLHDNSVITKDERIDEPYDETTGKQQSRYYVKYGWSDDVRKSLKNPSRMGNPLKDRVRRIYSEIYGK